MLLITVRLSALQLAKRYGTVQREFEAKKLYKEQYGSILGKGFEDHQALELQKRTLGSKEK